MRDLFDSPLARWAFPAVGILALACAAIAAYAWSLHR